jgi:hypothetical protein
VLRKDKQLVESIASAEIDRRSRLIKSITWEDHDPPNKEELRRHNDTTTSREHHDPKRCRCFRYATDAATQKEAPNLSHLDTIMNAVPFLFCSMTFKFVSK